jgi:hypothetical protein
MAFYKVNFTFPLLNSFQNDFLKFANNISTNYILTIGKAEHVSPKPVLKGLIAVH